MNSRSAAPAPGERPRCQNDDLSDCSAGMNRVAVQAGVVANTYRKAGILTTLRKIVATLVWKPMSQSRERASANSRPALVRKPAPDESLDLKQGELVEIKSREEILRTLDAEGKHRGLTIMPEMFGHCGRRFRVHRPVRRMMLEGTGEMRRVKNTVLLESSMCSGEPIGCDRSCFFFWREAWLRRVRE